MASNSNVGSTSKISYENDDPWVPEGFVCVVGPDEKPYMVPQFMLPAIFHEYHANKNREELNALGASGTVSYNFSRLC